MIELRDIRKSYGETDALRGIDVSIARGEVVGLLGPNGAGKTTAMKILVGYLLPSAGRARVAGLDVTQERREVQRKIGYLPENAPLYPDMLAQDYLIFVGRMRGMGSGIAARLREVVDACSIGDVLTRPIAQLSKGYRQRVGLAAAILHDPEILILDEPTNGLDPNQIVEVRDLIRRLGEAKTVILSTHILSEVEATCGRAVILIDGSIRADGRLDHLTRARSVVCDLSHCGGDIAEAEGALASIPGVAAIARGGNDGEFERLRLSLHSDDPSVTPPSVAEGVARLASERGWIVRELRVEARSLETVFRELTESVASDAREGLEPGPTGESKHGADDAAEGEA